VTLSFDVDNYTEFFTLAGIAFDFPKYLDDRLEQKLKLFYFARPVGYDG